jgi:hypothetical protein
MEPLAAKLTLARFTAPPWYHSGNTYTISSLSGTDGDVRYGGSWGDDDDCITIGNYGGTIEMLGESNVVEGMYDFKFTAFSFTLPSFGSSAMGGVTTGVNTFVLTTALGQSTGMVDPSSGDINAVLRLRLTNDYLPSSAPGYITLSVEGAINSNLEIEADFTSGLMSHSVEN